jgi:hypothetical protein
MKGPIILGFHAEKLHEDRVWRYVERVASRLNNDGMTATFFVYPYRAQVAGKDITERVQGIAALGHEIGQHTHFYAGTKICFPEKDNDLSDENIVHCVNRDFETLEEMNCSPKSFTAGAWFVNRTVCDTLVDLGFANDCSTRYPKSKDVSGLSDNVWSRSPRFHFNSRGRILCLPTTCSLAQWFKWGRSVRTEGDIPYQLIYLHDYDLLSPRNRVLFSLFRSIVRRRTLKPLAAVARQCHAAKVE